MNAYSPAADRVRAMSMLRLEWILDDAPEKRASWTPLEQAARDELKRRVLEAKRAS